MYLVVNISVTTARAFLLLTICSPFPALSQPGQSYIEREALLSSVEVVTFTLYLRDIAMHGTDTFPKMQILLVILETCSFL